MGHSATKTRDSADWYFRARPLLLSACADATRASQLDESILVCREG